MKKIVGFLIVISIVANSYALTETMQKVYKGVQDLKTNLQNAAGAFSAGNTTEAAEHINKAVMDAREAAADVMSTSKTAEDVVSKVKTAEETSKNVSEEVAKAYEKAKKAKEAAKNAIESNSKNDPQAVQKYQEIVYDFFTEHIPNLESLKNKVAELHQKAEKLSDVVQPKSTFGAKPFGGWFE